MLPIDDGLPLIAMTDEAAIIGALFSLANRLQTVGDRLDARITMKQWFVLAVISKHIRPDPTLGEVAELMGCSRQNAKRLATHLADDGLLVMTKDPDDGRVLRLSLTQECLAYLRTRDAAEERFVADLFAGLGAAQRQALRSGLEHLAQTTTGMLSEQTSERRPS